MYGQYTTIKIDAYYKNDFIKVMSCSLCGCIIRDDPYNKQCHDKFHEKLDELIAKLNPQK